MGKYQLVCYTRKELDDAIYSKKLAYSMHLAISMPNGEFILLNHNSGILYFKATSNPDGTLNAKSMKEPRIIINEDETFSVIAMRIEADGREDTEVKDKLFIFNTKDLIYYTEEKLLNDSDKYVDSYHRIKLSDTNKKIEEVATLAGKRVNELFDFECFVGNVIEISEQTAKKLITRFTTPFNIANEVQDTVTVSSRDEMLHIKAKSIYSDGSSVERPVDWYTDDVDWSKHGVTYEIEGKIHQNRYEFPIAVNRADPCIGKWKGKYYFIATNDADYNNSLYIREADTIPELATAQEVKILDTKMYPHLGGLLWAPEFHIIKGKLYIFHAGTPKDFRDEQSHVMALKDGGNPMKASDWEMSKKVVKKDGSPLYTAGITLDMTEFEVNGRYYVCWSQRQFVPVDQGAWLYFAEINPDEPWKLICDPVLISKPEFGWANNHTFVDEGPCVLLHNNKIYMTFSSAAVDSTYVVGLLTADMDADLLKPESWTKENYPLLSSRSVAGEYGTGHNAYITDDDGLIWNTYHARAGVNAPRSSGIRRVHFNSEDFPVLDMSEEMDVSSDKIWVKTKLIIK